MKKSIIILIFVIFYLPLHSQYINKNFSDPKERGAVAIGVLNGGGGLVGVDLEFLINDSFGIQGGIGFISYGLGLNYHFNSRGIRSSHINIGYWHQGIGESYVQSMIGPSYVFRARKIFQAQIGLGALLDTGPAYSGEGFPLLALYSLGIYLPFK